MKRHITDVAMREGTFDWFTWLSWYWIWVGVGADMTSWTKYAKYQNTTFYWQNYCSLPLRNRKGISRRRWIASGHENRLPLDTSLKEQRTTQANEYVHAFWFRVLNREPTTPHSQSFSVHLPTIESILISKHGKKCIRSCGQPTFEMEKDDSWCIMRQRKATIQIVPPSHYGDWFHRWLWQVIYWVWVTPDAFSRFSCMAFNKIWTKPIGTKGGNPTSRVSQSSTEEEKPRRYGVG